MTQSAFAIIVLLSFAKRKDSSTLGASDFHVWHSALPEKTNPEGFYLCWSGSLPQWRKCVQEVRTGSSSDRVSLATRRCRLYLARSLPAPDSDASSNSEKWSFPKKKMLWICLKSARCFGFRRVATI